MTNKTQSLALRLADEFKLCIEYDSIPSMNDIAKAETELRRLHARIAEDAARLKEAVGLLDELAEHGNYSTEYDGRMLSICPECGEQDGEHRPKCAFVRARDFLAARKQKDKV